METAAATIAVLVLAICLAALAFMFGHSFARYSFARDACEAAARAEECEAGAMLVEAGAGIFILAVAGWPS